MSSFERAVSFCIDASRIFNPVGAFEQAFDRIGPTRNLHDNCSATLLVKPKHSRHHVVMKRRASVAWPSMLRLAPLLALSALACSSGKATTSEDHAFDDGAGRTCHAKLAKTSPTTPPVGETVTCEGEARQCSAESAPCFELNVDRETFAIKNCPACCRGSASSFTSADCSPVLCASDADCIYRQAKCVDGACTCPNGYCD